MGEAEEANLVVNEYMKMLRMLNVLVEEKGWKWSAFHGSPGFGSFPGAPNDDFW